MAIRRFLNDLQKCAQSDDNFKAPGKVLLIYRFIRRLLRNRLTAQSFSKKEAINR